MRTVEREISYDYLIVATGSRHSYFGHNEWEKLAPGLKSLEDAVEIRRRMLDDFAAGLHDFVVFGAPGCGGGKLLHHLQHAVRFGVTDDVKRKLG